MPKACPYKWTVYIDFKQTNAQSFRLPALNYKFTKISPHGQASAFRPFIQKVLLFRTDNSVCNLDFNLTTICTKLN